MNVSFCVILCISNRAILPIKFGVFLGHFGVEFSFFSPVLVGFFSEFLVIISIEKRFTLSILKQYCVIFYFSQFLLSHCLQHKKNIFYVEAVYARINFSNGRMNRTE